MSITELYSNHYGVAPTQCELLSAAGSNRRYYRLTDGEGQTVIGVEGTSAHENHAFITMARHFATKHLNTPKVIVASDDEMCYLQEDLGNSSLYDTIKKHVGHWEQDADEAISLLRTSLTLLPRFQVEANDGMDYSVCHPINEMNYRSIMWDLNYFKYCFIKLAGIEFDENALEDDFESLTAQLINRRREMKFMYRDFQSRNIMLTPTGPMFIDFQGGRRGPLLYDVVSFLWQARLQLPEHIKMSLFEDYLTALECRLPETNTNTLRADLQYWVLFRTLQVLGAYGFRGYHERKQQFLDSIEPAISSLLSQPLLYNYKEIYKCISILN